MNIDFAKKFKDLRDFFKLTQEEFAKEIGISRSVISQIEISRFDPTIEVIANISVKFNVDLKYFFNNSLCIRDSVKNAHLYAHLTGKVESKNDEKKPLKVVSEKRDVLNDATGVPYYEQLSATAGNFNDLLADSTATSLINLPQINDCIAVLPVYGSSMKGIIDPGDLIAIKEITSRSEFDPAMPYLVITNEHRMVKYLRVDVDNTEIIWAESTNHKPIKIESSNIIHVYAIKCVIRFF